MLSLDGLPNPARPLLVTDQIGAPSEFLLQNIFASHLRNSLAPGRCLFVSSTDESTKWKAISLRSVQTEGAFAFVDLSPRLPDPISSLVDIYQDIRTGIETLSQDGIPSLVILDGLTVLEWFGVPIVEVVSFLRALIAFCGKRDVALVIRHHIVSTDEPDDLLRHLLQLCAHHVEVRPLSSGKSGAVSGEIAVHACPLTSTTSARLIPRHHAMQYRLTESSATFFERGTGQVVL
ncbi:hypothetical protein OF83DRAFT_1227905 [Amylostereum chailletii]|nr:hypothetical protein OF83DRAFT_1227905 [Amylostereum chailletii]